MISIGHYTLDYSMFDQRGNLFIAYGLVKVGNPSLGIMEKIDVERMSIKEIKRLLFEGKILNAASIVALYRALDFHEHLITEQKSMKSLTEYFLIKAIFFLFYVKKIKSLCQPNVVVSLVVSSSWT